VYCTSA